MKVDVPTMKPLSSAVSVSDQHLLREPTLGGAELRRSFLRGRALYVLGGGPFWLDFIYNKLESLGLQVYIVDLPSSIWTQAPHNAPLAGFLPFDFHSDHASVGPRFEAALRAHPHLPPPDGVISYNEATVKLAPIIAQHLGLPHHPLEAVDASQDKDLTRQAIRRAGLRTARHAVVHSEEDVLRSVEDIGFPLIVKPTFGYGSVGVRFAKRKEDVLEAFQMCREAIRPDSNPVFKQGDSVILEEYLDGPERIIDVVLYEDKMVYAAVLDDPPNSPPYFEVRGYTVPTQMPRKESQELKQYVHECLRALGFSSGVFDVECRLTKRGPVLLEVNPRMGCGPVYFVHKTVHGADMIEEAVNHAMGIPIAPVVSSKARKNVLALILFTPCSGVVENVQRVMNIGKGDEQVLQVRITVKEGQKVVGPKDGMATEIASVVITGDSLEEAKKKALEIVERTDVPVRTGNNELPGRFPYYF